MAEKYRLYYDEVMGKKDLIGKEHPIDIEVFDTGAKEWMDTKSLVSSESMEGWDQVTLVGPFGNLVEEGKFYIKIVEEVPPED